MARKPFRRPEAAVRNKFLPLPPTLSRHRKRTREPNQVHSELKFFKFFSEILRRLQNQGSPVFSNIHILFHNTKKKVEFDPQTVLGLFRIL